MSTTDFYRAFEDLHRGPRELIHQRLEAYRPFIKALPGIYQPANAIDLGCGRGEWIELLLSAGFAPQGVDLDTGMLSACIERGLPVVQGDAIAHLKSLDDESQCVVSGFHIVEHIAFDDLETLVIHALRVLKPGGLLILETPNPENVVVGTSNFYVDPTHLRPIPPLLLSFLPEHHGFARLRIVRLQESAELRQRRDVHLMEVLGGVSPDYAVVAQKGAAFDVMANFDAAFEAHYGVQLHELADRYDGTRDERMAAIEKRLLNAEAQASEMTGVLDRISTLQDRLMEFSTHHTCKQTECDQLQAEVANAAQRLAEAGALAQEHEQRAAAAEALAQEQHKRIDELGANSHHWWQQACVLEAERNALRKSASWRITAPLRAMAGLVVHPVHAVRSGANHVVHGIINSFQRPLSRLMTVVLRQPRLSYRINEWLLHYPELHQQLMGVAQRCAVSRDAPAYLLSGGQIETQKKPELENLTPRARQIYAELNACLKKH